MYVVFSRFLYRSYSMFLEFDTYIKPESFFSISYNPFNLIYPWQFKLLSIVVTCILEQYRGIIIVSFSRDHHRVYLKRESKVLISNSNETFEWSRDVFFLYNRILCNQVALMKERLISLKNSKTTTKLKYVNEKHWCYCGRNR